MRPLILLVIAELLVIVLLALQWAGSSATVLAGDHAAPPSATNTNGAVPAAGTVAATTPSAPAERVAATTDARVAARDAIGVIVGGTIRGTDGTLVEGASIGLRRDNEYHGGNTAAPGAYAIGGLQPGEWTMLCRAEGYAQHEAACTLDERAFQRVDVEMKPSWTVRVKVVDASGKPVLDELRKKTSWGLPYAIATDTPLAGDLPPTEQSRLIRFGLGEWRSYDGMGGKADPKAMEAGYLGELLMDRAPPAHASLLLRTTLLQGQPIAAGQKELVFTIEVKDVLARHGTVKLRLVDATGKPIAGAAINVSTAQGGGTGGKTNDEGRATIENVLPGIGTLESWQRSEEREGLHRFVRVGSGAVVDLGDIALTAAAKITGLVVDGDGKPVNGASVQWTELDCRTFPQSLVSNRSASADADGKFQLWGAGRHRYVVFARPAEWSDPRLGFATVDATGGAPPAVTITLAKTTAVKLNAGFDMTVGRIVTALAKDRSPAAVATLGTEYRPPSLSLLPGDYTIEVHDLQTCRLVHSTTLHVGNEPLTLDVP